MFSLHVRYIICSLFFFCCFFCSRTSSVMAADDKSSSSSMEWTTETPVTLPVSPSHLTHFKPLSPEQDEPPLRSAYSSFVNLFRFSNKGKHFMCILFLKCFLFPCAKRLKLFFMEVTGSDHSLVKSGDRKGLSGLMPGTSELNITHTFLSLFWGQMIFLKI